MLLKRVTTLKLRFINPFSCNVADWIRKIYDLCVFPSTYTILTLLQPYGHLGVKKSFISETDFCHLTFFSTHVFS